MSNVDKKDLLLLFYRVGEPLYFPKGSLGETCYFDLSPDYLPNIYKDKAPQLLNRSNQGEGRRIDVGSLLSDALLRIPLDQVQVVKRRDYFSPFIPQHQRAAGRLISIFMGLKNMDDFMAFACYVRDRVNPQLYVYALCSAIIHRADTKDLRVPSYVDVFPDKFVNCESVANARENAEIFKDEPSERVPIEIPENYTGSDADPEHRLAYFREDIGVNLHHWHWHLIYPFEGPDAIVRKDRRGELFYHMHHQIMARYNVDRLCNHLDLARIIDWNEPIEEAYFPGLTAEVAGKTWPSRPANMRLSDVNRPDYGLRFDVEDLTRFRERIYEAIHRKSVIGADGQNVDINNDKGVDVLGNMVEASILTPNAEYYGNIHNLAHLAVAFIHDPQNKYHQTSGLMAETNVAMRDPVFYRVHALVDDIFDQHKRTRPSYDRQNLTFKGIEITSMELCSLTDDNECKDKNTLRTFKMKSDINMSRGLDFAPRGPILVRVTHLNHDEFLYNIKVKNTTGSVVYGTVRIFLGPRQGFGGYDLSLDEQRLLMIEMDKFVAKLEPGENTIKRKSLDANITIPFEQTFRNLDANRPDEANVDEFAAFNYCGCGWPQHMLVPKGTADGYPMILYAIITDYEEDKVNSNSTGQKACRTGVSFCGLRDKKYPDKRPMGYPFDRPIRDGVDSLQQFLTPNMATTSVSVVHSNTVKDGNLVSSKSIPADDLNTRH